MTTVAEQLVDRLSAWGVHRVFGYRGASIDPVISAFERAAPAFELVEGCDEEMAAFMACGHAKLTDEVGVCVAPSGAPVAHLLSTLYDAEGDHQPLVAILGQRREGEDLEGTLELLPRMRNLAPDCVQIVRDAAGLEDAVDRAFNLARSERLPSCILLSEDLLARTTGGTSSPRSPERAPDRSATTIALPPDEKLSLAASELARGKRVAMIIGVGARQAIDDALHVADKLRAGVADALLGVATLPDDLPYVTGGVGLLGTRATENMLASCDTLVVVGVRADIASLLPPGATPYIVRIDDHVGTEARDERLLLGDPRRVLRALAALLPQNADGDFRLVIEAEVLAWRAKVERRAMKRALLVSPERVFLELSPRLPERVMLACDSGNAVHWFARHLRVRRGMSVLHGGFVSATGTALPYALAAKLAHPDRAAMAIVGDGAMQMRGLGELATLAKHWPTWSDGRFVVVVLNDGTLRTDAWERRVVRSAPIEGRPPPAFSYADFASLLGLTGITVADVSELPSALDEAIHADVPVVLDIRTDPTVAPFPPNVSRGQAERYAMALLEGDPEFAHGQHPMPTIEA